MADAASFPLNLTLMRNPANWVIIGMMMLFAILAMNIITDQFNANTEGKK